MPDTIHRLGHTDYKAQGSDLRKKLIAQKLGYLKRTEKRVFSNKSFLCVRHSVCVTVCMSVHACVCSCVCSS